MNPVPSPVMRALEVSYPQYMNALRRQEARCIAIRLDHFEGEPGLLYGFLCYAASLGRLVLVSAET